MSGYKLVRAKVEVTAATGDAWFKSLTKKQKDAYLKLHPKSKYGKGANKTAKPTGAKMIDTKSISVEKLPNGFIRVSALVNGTRESRKYQGYSEKESVNKFKSEIKALI